MLLMHKDIPVADVSFENGEITKVNKKYSREHYPLGAYTHFSHLLPKSLANWQKNRTIPNERQNASAIIGKIGCSLSEAALKSLGVSLTDCYWFKTDENLSWKDVNYHDNGFSQDFGYSMLFKQEFSQDYNSPDFTTDGMLEKYWLSLDGVPTLLKFGNLGTLSKGENLLSANEIIASKIAALMNIEHVNYSAIQLPPSGERIACCPCFINDSDTEFVSALQLEKQYGIYSGASLYNFFSDRLNMQRFVDNMIAFDYVIGNTDRHEKNFGVIINPSSFAIISPAPLFDNGSCLGWNGEYSLDKTPVKPFNESAQKQIEMIKIRPDNIPSVSEAHSIIEDVYSAFKINEQHIELAKKEIADNICGFEKALAHSFVSFSDLEKEEGER